MNTKLNHSIYRQRLRNSTGFHSESAPTSKRTSFALFGLLVVLYVVMLTTLLAGADSWITVGALIYPSAIVAFASWRLSEGLSSDNYSYIRQFIYVYIYVNFGLAAAVQLGLNRFPWIGIYSQGDIAFAYGMIAFGIGTFEWFWQRIVEEKLAQRASSVLPGGYVSMPTRVLIAAGLLGVLGMLIFWRIGWAQVVFVTRSEAAEAVGGELGDSSVYMLAVRNMYSLPFVAGMLYLYVVRRDPHAGVLRKIVLNAGAFVFLLFSVVVANPISTARFWVATVMVALVGLFCYTFYPRLLRFIPIALVLGYLVVFPIADAYRNKDVLRNVQQAASYRISDNVREAYLTGDFDSLQQVMNAMKVVRENGPALGRQIVGTVFFWVPRSIWHEKPLSSGELVGTLVGYRFTNLSCPLWAEGYLDLSWPGVFIAMALYAILVGWVSRMAIGNGPCEEIVVVFTLIAGPYSVFLLRGCLMTSLAFISPTILATGLYILLARAGRSPPPKGQRAPIVRRSWSRRIQ